MQKATCSSPIIHYQAQRMGVVSISLTHASPPPQSSHIQLFLKKNNQAYSVIECSVSVSEEPLSETSFQTKEAFPKLLCNNFNTDRVSMFIVLQQNAPI